MKEKIAISIEKEILKKIDRLVDEGQYNNRSNAIEGIIKKQVERDTKAVILSGGSYERNVEKGELKCLKRYKGRSVLDWQISTFKKQGFNKIFFIGAERTIKEVIAKEGFNITKKVDFVMDETNQGNFTSLKNIRNKVNDDFLVVYNDIFFDYDLKELLNFHRKEKTLASVICTISPESKRKGEFVLRGDKIIDFSQKGGKGTHIFTGSIFAMSPEILDMKGKRIEEDLFPELIKRKMLSGIILPGQRIHFQEE
jgi:NDP-sugar pyrophosphorylase family protein